METASGQTDVRGASFRSQAHRQSMAVAASDDAGGNQAFVDEVSTLDAEDCQQE